MDKRKAARLARINEVLFHKDIIDRSDELDALHQLAESGSHFYKLNVQWALSTMDETWLELHGWKSSAAGTGNASHELTYEISEAESLLLVLSREGEWLHLTHVSGLPVERNDLDKETWALLEPKLLPAIKMPAPQSLDDEVAYIIAHWPPLRTATGKIVDPQQESASSLFSRIIHYWEDSDIHHAVGHAFSMARHFAENRNACVGMAMGLSGLVRQSFFEDALRASVCLLLLECAPDGCICTQYEAVASLLHDMGFHQSALYCSNITWLYTQKQTVLDYSNFQQYAEYAIGQLISEKRYSQIPAVLKAVDYCLSRLSSPELSISASYLRGLLACRENNLEEALRHFQETSRLLSALEPQMMERRYNWLTILMDEWIPSMEESIRNKRKRANKLFSRFLHFYPILPGQDVWISSTLPELVDYPPHVFHWQAVFGSDTSPDEIAARINAWRPRTGKEPSCDFYFFKGIHTEVIRWHRCRGATETQDLDVIFTEHLATAPTYRREPSVKQLSTEFFPAMKSDRTNEIVAPIETFALDEQNGACLASLALPQGSVEYFLLPDDDNNELYGDDDYSIQFCAWGYVLERMVTQKIPLKKKGKNKDSFPFDEVVFGEDLRVLSNTGDCRDDIFFVAKVVDIRKTCFMGTDFLRILLEFDERALDIKLPLFINPGNIADGYKPNVGDVVTGNAWLQGRVCSKDLESIL